MRQLKIKLLYCFIVCAAIVLLSSTSLAQKKEWYQIKVYHLSGRQQEQRIDTFLQNAFLPALHRAGIKNTGVFKPVEADSMAGKLIYVLIPYESYKKVDELTSTLQKDAQYAADGKNYFNAPYTDPPYTRMESILLEAFDGMPALQKPHLNLTTAENIYELRSYEGATEYIHANKMEMFNKGDEFGLFKRLGFNTVFCGEVFAGAHMPNLMYMTCFDNMAAHDEHWKNFVADPQWKKLSAMPEYQHNVSHIDIVLLHRASYSDF